MRRALFASVLTSRSAVACRHSTAKPADGNAKLDDLAAAYSQLTLREVSDLQRLIFKKLGHSDDFYEKALLRGLSAGGGAVMMAPTAAAAAAPAAAAEAVKAEKKKVEKLTYDVKLEKYAPEIKIKLIKELRTVTNLSIADAKKAVEKCPGLVATNMSKDDAEKLKGLYEKLGAKVELL
uniref:60S ribosomal protein, putative n=1 Tax=Leishmania guyanensis TaxID=5670 RepID=A0A1E1IRJ5_LEIGU|nr:60S ribosomal protein, putative [Leishmania guyanensis]